VTGRGKEGRKKKMKFKRDMRFKKEEKEEERGKVGR
jgi:hypothetical protein